MATYTEVKRSLDDIAQIINTERQSFASAKARIQTGSANLNAITTQYADVITTIDAYTGTDAAETLAQAEKAKLAAEFTELKGEIDALIASF
jgi:uncharacterized protein involved in exopolysaccharide biosynthesis